MALSVCNAVAASARFLNSRPLATPPSSFSAFIRSAKVHAAAGSDASQTLTSDRVIEDAILSGEWPESFSFLNFEDLCKHYETVIFKEQAQPEMLIASVMSKKIFTAMADQLLEEVEHHFENISGLPVINKDLKCIGVLSKKDRAKASEGLKSKVGEVMTSPAISLSVDKTVNDAAILMLKRKIHRIPVVNETNQVVGIVTRTDIFKALEGEV